MKQVLIGIFAHPDDAEFGPCGTLLKLVSEGYDLHLLLLTDGEAGSNPDNVPDLGAVRLQEWQTAAKLLGAASTAALHLPDGGLTKAVDELAYNKLHEQLQRVISLYDQPIELSIMTLEPHGITEHTDHVSASRLATRLFEVVKSNNQPAITSGKLWYFCLSLEQAPITEKTAYYVPRGREADFINTEVDVSNYLAQKYEIMDVHTSQRADAETAKKRGDSQLSTEYFCVVN